MNTGVERLAALTELLARPDPRWLKRRGHVLTQPGKRERWATWLSANQAWTAQRLSEALGPVDGWKPAERDVHRLPAFLRPLTPDDHLKRLEIWIHTREQQYRPAPVH